MDLSDNGQAMDAIRDVGPGKHFLGCAHTMANYTTADIKTLREKTAAGMLDVKKALDEADGDMAKAEDILRVKGLKGVTKREGRTASNGR
mgnify:CR=1 FL=1